MRPETSPFGLRLRALREAAGFTQEELATIAGLSVHAISALERGQRRRPHPETVRAISMALDLAPPIRDAFMATARATAQEPVIDWMGGSALPVPMTPLVGREVDLLRLHDWLADARVRLITLVGPGGVGKTRLALEIARALEDADLVRVAFASLATVRDAALVGSTVAEAFGWGEVTGRDLPGRARTVLEETPTVLVLDNFEHVMDAAPLVMDLLSAAPQLRILVTSRAPLHIRGEREYSVEPLSLETVDEFAEHGGVSPAVQLFVNRVRDALPDFRVTEENAAVLVAICRRLDALPLALELAAPWVKVLSVEELHRRLQQGMVPDAGGPRDLPQRQRTMNATVAWSYELLPPAEQRAFRRFGALPGLFPIPAAAAVLAGGTPDDAGHTVALEATAAMIDRSLLVRVGPSVVPTCTLFQMFETVRAYAAQQLAASGERDQAMEGLVRYCVSEAGLARHGLSGASQLEWLDRTREDLRSYRAALGWLLENGRAEEASEISSALVFFWVIRGYAAEGLRWYERVLTIAPKPSTAYVRALVGAAVTRYAQADLPNARKAIDEAVSLADLSRDGDTVFRARMFSGHIELALGNTLAAREHFEAALQGFRDFGMSWAVGHTLSGLAWAALVEGRNEEAERLLAESNRTLAAGGPWFFTLNAYLQAVLALRRGDFNRALTFLKASLQRIQQFQDTFAYLYALIPLAGAAGLAGDDRWVARLTGARSAIIERTGARVADPLVRQLCRDTELRARARLSAEEWADAYAAGKLTSIDSLIQDIDKAQSCLIAT